MQFLGYCVFATGQKGALPGKGIVWESTGRARVAAAMMDFRFNPGWEVSTDRRQNVPFETGYVRVNTQEDAAFSPGLDGAQTAMYVRAGQLVVAYNDSGTTRYRTMPFIGTSTPWTHSTTAPPRSLLQI